MSPCEGTYVKIKQKSKSSSEMGHLSFLLMKDPVLRDYLYLWEEEMKRVQKLAESMWIFIAAYIWIYCHCSRKIIWTVCSFLVFFMDILFIKSLEFVKTFSGFLQALAVNWFTTNRGQWFYSSSLIRCVHYFTVFHYFFFKNLQFWFFYLKWCLFY